MLGCDDGPEGSAVGCEFGCLDGCRDGWVDGCVDGQRACVIMPNTRPCQAKETYNLFAFLLKPLT